MKKDEKRKRNKREAFRRSATRVLCASVALVLIASLIAVPCFALGTGTQPSVSRTGEVVYPVINDLVVTEVTCDRDAFDDGEFIYVYRNSYSLPLFDVDIIDGKTAMQYSLDGDRVATREVSYNYDTATKVALYDRLINQPLTSLGAIPDGLLGSPIVEFEFDNVVDLSTFDASQVEFGYYLGASDYPYDMSYVSVGFSASYDYYNTNLDKWATFTLPVRCGDIELVTTVDGTNAYLFDVSLSSLVASSHTVIRNFTLSIHADFSEMRVVGGNIERVELTDSEVRSYGFFSRGISTQMPYTEEPINNSEVIITAPPVYFDDDFNILSWVVDVVTSFLDVPLFTTVSGLSVITIGSLIGLVVTFGFVFVILKFFYGG